MPTHLDTAAFYEWAFSDLLTNTVRGVFAEYIVARALGCTEEPRIEWNAYDLVTKAGLRIEVKSTAYLQSWKQKGHSILRFDIAPKRGWDAETNTSSVDAKRSADVYVFCVFAATEKPADPRQLDHWFFLVCAAPELDRRFGKQKSANLSTLEAAGMARIGFDQLADAVGRAAEDAKRA